MHYLKVVYIILSPAFVLLAFTVPNVAGAFTAVPSEYGFTTPLPDPVLPSGIDTFTPPLLGSGSGPGVAEFTRTADPDDIIVLAGDQFASTTVFRFYGQTSSGNAVTVDRSPNLADGVAANVLVPSQLLPWSMYLVWPQNVGVYGLPVAINRTDAWWLGPNPTTALAGQTASIYGRNLAHNNGTTTSYVYIKPTGGGTGQWVTPTAVNPYKVDFTVPNLVPGTYEVWAHNGHGGDFGWSGPLSMTVLSQSTFAGQASSTFSVLAYGATGNGVTDDTAAIQSAINAAGVAAPATVYFPAGTYLVSSPLLLPNDVSYLGAASTTSIIEAASNFATNAPALFDAPSYSTINNVAFTNLNVEANGDLGSADILSFESHANLQLVNSVFNWMGQTSSGFNLGGTNNVVMTGNTFVGNGVFLGNASNVEISNNTFRLTDDANAAIYSWGGLDLSVTNNYASDYQPGTTTLAGSGSGRFFVAQSHPDANRYFYIAGNTTYDMAPITNVGPANEGEQILLETGSFPFRESPTAETATTATFPDSLPVDGTEYSGEVINVREAMITAGTGVGQTRYVTNVSGHTITVSPAWSVTPDSTSVIGVGPGAFNIAIYDNTLDGKANYATYGTASVGVQMYGNTSAVIVADNTLTNMNGGISDEFSQVPTSTQPTPSALYFNLIANNSLNGSYTGFGQDTSNLAANNTGTLGHLGNSYRSNTLSNIVFTGIHLGPEYQGYTGGNFDQNVFEHNSITNVPVGIETSFPVYTIPGTPVSTIFGNYILYGDNFTLGNAAYSGSSAFSILGTTTNFWCSGDTWTGFASTTACSGVVPSATVVTAKAGLGQIVQLLGRLHIPGGLHLF